MIEWVYYISDVIDGCVQIIVCIVEVDGCYVIELDWMLFYL